MKFSKNRFWKRIEIREQEKNQEKSIAITRNKTFQNGTDQAAMAEWLRRLTRNQMGSCRAGSNPAGCDEVFEI